MLMEVVDGGDQLCASDLALSPSAELGLKLLEHLSSFCFVRISRQEAQLLFFGFGEVHDWFPIRAEQRSGRR